MFSWQWLLVLTSFFKHLFSSSLPAVKLLSLLRASPLCILNLSLPSAGSLFLVPSLPLPSLLLIFALFLLPPHYSWILVCLMCNSRWCWKVYPVCTVFQQRRPSVLSQWLSIWRSLALWSIHDILSVKGSQSHKFSSAFSNCGWSWILLSCLNN